MTEDHDLTTVEGAKKAIHDLNASQKRQAAEHKASLAQRDDAIADLKASVRTLTEAQNRTTLRAPGDAAVQDFIYQRKNDGSPVIRWQSGLDQDGDWHDGLLNTLTDDPWITRCQELVEQRTLVRAMTKGKAHKNANDNSPKTDAALARHLQRAPDPLKRLFSDATSTGGEFIPDVLSPRLEEEMKLQRRVEALVPVWQMSDKELRIPFLGTELRPYIKAAITTDDPAQYTSSTIVSAQRSVTATGLAVRAQLDEDTTEDSIIGGLPLHRRLVVSGLGDGVEDAMINADTNATHDDTGLNSWDIRSRWGTTGLGGSADHRRAWIGWRASAADRSSTVDGSSAETAAGLLSDRATLDSPHGVAGDLIMVVSPEYYLAKMLGWSEVLTVDKFGPNATIHAGQLASVLGIPIIISEFVDKEYNASGVFDNTTKTKTGYILVNRQRWFMGVRRANMVEVDKDITRGVINVVSTVRKQFFTIDSTTKKNVMWSYNHSVS